MPIDNPNLAPLQPATPKPIDLPSEPLKPLVKPIISGKSKRSTVFMVIGAFVVVVLGVLTGWFLAGSGKTSGSDDKTSAQISSKDTPDEAGIGDEDSYGTSTEGVLKEGGIKGEGTHYIDRGLGESKYVYLTSSVVDLDSFIDKKVEIWGETISAKYASWMIDVGKIKVVK